MRYSYLSSFRLIIFNCGFSIKLTASCRERDRNCDNSIRLKGQYLPKGYSDTDFKSVNPTCHSELMVGHIFSTLYRPFKLF